LVKKTDVDIFQKKISLQIAQAKSGVQIYRDTPPRISLNQLHKIYSESRKNEIKSIDRNLYALKLMMKYVNPGTPISQLNYELIHQFRDDLLSDRSRNVSDNNKIQKIRRGVNRDLHNLRIIFNWSYRKGKMSFRLFEKVDFLRVNQYLPDVLTVDEFNRFYECLANDKQRFAAVFILYTGLRRGEAFALTVENLASDFSWIRITQSKSGRERIVPIHADLAPIIANWIKANNLVGPDRLLQYEHREGIYQAFSKALKNAGIKKNSAVHLLRHTFGFRIISSNPTDGQRRLAQDLLGHSDPRMTDHYTQIAIESLAQNLEKVKFR
jgi:integrase